MKNICLLLFLVTSLYSGAQLPVSPDKEEAKPVFHIPVFTDTIYDSSLTGYYFMLAQKNMVIMDQDCNLVYFSRVNALSACFSLLPNGLMSYSNLFHFFFLDSTFRKVDSVSCKNNIATDVHEMLVLPNGHLLVLGIDLFTMNLSKYYWKGKPGSDTATVRCAVIQELDANRNLVFEWCAKDHFDFADMDTNYTSTMKLIDWTHSNAMEIDSDGNILLSSRNMNEITKINRKDGSVMWRWGGKHNQFKFINCPVPFYAQHDIRRIANGHYTLFDNGLHKPPHGARAMEFELDQKNKTATLVWSYTFDSTLHSRARGNVQRIQDSKTVISYGENDKKLCFVVVDTTGRKYLQVNGLQPYRVLHYSALPWQLHRPQISCFDSLSVTYLDAGAGYKSYHWNTGDTMRIIRASPANEYFVFVPYGEGYISSEKFMVANASSPCGILPASEKKRNNK